jgi:hypothetical protein
MTLAIGLWVARAVCFALWTLEHWMLARRARRRGRDVLASWLMAPWTRWMDGERVGPVLWLVYGVVYVVLWRMSLRVR